MLKFSQNNRYHKTQREKLRSIYTIEYATIKNNLLGFNI